jgi:hypothetical protein
MVVKASDPSLCGLFDLGKLATHKSSLISLDFIQKVSKSAKRKENRGFAHLCND